MSESVLLAPWIRRFLLEYLRMERNLARNTQRSYRDAILLLLTFLSRQCNLPVDQLTFEHFCADQLRLFLLDLEQGRQCGIRTRNQRLAALHALALFVGQHHPEQLDWCRQIRSVPFKKHTQAVLPYLDKAEMDALLAVPDCQTAPGRRDHTLLLFLYNSGARAEETARLKITDLELRGSPAVRIHGKGNKIRHCPLWPVTTQKLADLVSDRKPAEPVFLNRCGRPLTRYGIHALVERYVIKAASQMPSLTTKRVSPHTIRHTTATHLLRAGVDINTIRAWLGHVSLNTTNVYLEIDLQMKAKALAKCEPQEQNTSRQPWSIEPTLVNFLRSL